MTSPPSDLQIKGFGKLIEKFNELPKIKHDKTLMEVAGYSHYENVASNILAFFFDPNEEHGLGDLLLNQFLYIQDESLELDLNGIEIEREFVTETRKRIDLLITGKDFALCIENKIFHWLANDLEDYSSTMEQLGSGKNHIYKVVLSLHTIPDNELKGGFTSISYPQLWEKVRSAIPTEKPNRWFTFLYDFMDTTENFVSEQKTHQSTDQFFSENHEAIESLLKFREDFYNRLRQRNDTLKANIDESGIATEHCRLWHAYKKTCLVFDFKHPENYNISFDLFINPRGWKLLLFGRGKSSVYFLNTLLDHHKEEISTYFTFPTTKEGFKHVVKEWKLDESIESIVHDLENIVISLSKVLEDQNQPQANELPATGDST